MLVRFWPTGCCRSMKCLFEGVLSATNHLESFNDVLKHIHLHRWQCSGRHVRLDILTTLSRFCHQFFSHVHHNNRRTYVSEPDYTLCAEALLLARQNQAAPDLTLTPMIYLLPGEAGRISIVERLRPRRSLRLFCHIHQFVAKTKTQDEIRH